MRGGSATTLLIATAAACSAVLLWARDPRLPPVATAVAQHRRGGRAVAWAGVGTAVLVVTVSATAVRGAHLALVLVVWGGTAGVLRLAAGARRAREAAARRQVVVDYCEAVLGELQGGQPVLRALERSQEVWTESEPVVAASRLGADVPTALRRLAEAPGAEGLTRLAAAWQLCASTGTGLAFAVAQVLETARAAQATERLVKGELASARATARLVTALPVVVLVAAQGVGARPWSFLLSTSAGVTCLAGGVALALAGLWWIERIAEAALSGKG